MPRTAHKVEQVIRSYLVVYDNVDNPVTGLQQADFDVSLLHNGTPSSEPVSIVEINNGQYMASFTPSQTGTWYLMIRQETHNKRGWVETFDVFEQGLDDVAAHGEAMTLTPAERLQVADALLKRDMSAVETTAAMQSLCSAILKLTSRFRSITGVTYRSDGVTPHMTQTPSFAPSAQPIVELSKGI